MDTKQEMINDLLDQIANKENEFLCFEDVGGSDYIVRFPAHKENYRCMNADDLYKKVLKGYSGIAVEINDHGNVTVYKCFKNGNRREIASRV
jgi:hypothetical protein